MSQSLCYCLVSRQGNIIKAHMRHWWNNMFFAIIRVMIFLNHFILMAPFIYAKKKPQRTSAASNVINISTTKWHYRTHRLVTGLSVALCLLLTIAAPFLVKMSTDLYGKTRREQDRIFSIIACSTVTLDIVCSTLIMAMQIWYRENLVKILNEIFAMREKMCRFEQDIVSLGIFVVLLLKCALTLYEVSLSIPFLVTAKSRLTTANIIGFVIILFVQHFSTIYALTVFVHVLLLLTITQQLEKQLKNFENISNNIKMLQLISLQNDLHKLITLVLKTTQLCTFSVILLYFVTILCNIYALLDYYVTTGNIYWTFVTYLVSIVVELYCLILVAYLCERSQKRVCDLIIRREEHYFLQPPAAAFEMVDTSVLWPHHEEFFILGLFTLNNEFALFLLAYSVSFIMIILEFELNKALNINST